MKIGQKVICISDYDNSSRYESLPKKDKIYTIRTIEELRGNTYIRLNEIINQSTQYMEGYMEIQFDMCDFRPLDYDFVNEVIEMINNEQFTISNSL